MTSIRFKKDQAYLILVYTPENWDIEEVIKKINTPEGLTIRKTFFLSKESLYISEKDCIENQEVQFIVGNIKGNYYEINKTILNINNSLYIFKDIPILAKYFVSYKNISIFNKIDKLKINQPIYIGGEERNNLPIEVLDRLVKQFPNQHETMLYANACICGIIKDYLDISDEAELKYKNYLNKKRQNFTKRDIPLKSQIKEAEKEKYIYLSETLKEMLANGDHYSEEAWQKKLLDVLTLVFPKYISVLSKIQINGKKQLDYLLIDANGYVDVVEIKKPSKNSLLYQKQYRNNFTPLKDLSGSVMQTEKYIFDLSRWGENGENTLNNKYKDKLPEGLKIKIINPKGIIIMGRENDLSAEQKQDFEFIKRQYKNIIEIITYDNLIERIKRVINSFSIEDNI